VRTFSPPSLRPTPNENAPYARLTPLALSCTAKTHVPKPRGAAAAAHTAGQQRAICSRRDTAPVLFGQGGSAAGPKPGRAGFSDELGRQLLRANLPKPLRT
jgi:hypothetical protein